MGRKDKSQLYVNMGEVNYAPQLSLFGEIKQPVNFDPFPPIYKDTIGFYRTLGEAIEEGAIGYDLEFTGLRPTILGIASRRSASSVPATPELIEQVVSTNLPLVGHAVISADRPVTEHVIGRLTDISQWEDTLIYFYLLHLHYAKIDDRSDSGEGVGEGSSFGLFDLFTACSHYLMIPSWKNCRGIFCSGPCPKHDPFGYNALDSWAPLAAWYLMKKEYLDNFGDMEVYNARAQVTEVSQKRQVEGVTIDVKKAAEIDAVISAERLRLMKLLPFNPGSSPQIISWFGKNGIQLEDADKEAILNTFRDQARLKHNFDYNTIIRENSKDVAKEKLAAFIETEASEVVKVAYYTWQWKEAGKGIKSWVDDKYLDRQGKLHPRMITTSTATGRLSCASPNLTNVPSRGAMSVVKTTFIPRSPELQLIKADYSQLELRIVLNEAGYSEALSGDVYSMVTAGVGDLFVQPAADTNRKPRDIAKIVVLGSNYMLGFTARDVDSLRSGYARRQINAGALHVFEDWEYSGMYMCMDGKKLAFMLYGDGDDLDNRRKAIEVQLGYLNQYGKVHEWHRKVAREIELTNQIRRKNGMFLNLLADPNDNLKKATAFLGQGYGSDYFGGSIEKLYNMYGQTYLLAVHDELVYEAPVEWGDEECYNFIEPMAQENKRYPGFSCPIEAKRGPSWGELSLINV